MKDGICPSCGGRNPAGVEFCVLCNAYLGWEDRQEWAPVHRGHDVAPDTQLRAEVEQQNVVVTPEAPPSAVTVRLTNLSTVVEAYRVAAVNAPSWLTVRSGQARLLPGTEGRVQLTLAIDAKHLIPVHRLRLQVRVQGESSQALWREVSVDVVVGAVTSPVELRLEPRQVQVRDDSRAAYRVVLDNRRSNVPMTFELSGRDHEEQVSFDFEPALVEVPPGETATAGMRVDAPLPPAGEQLNRTLTVVAVSGEQELTATAGLAQSTSAMVMDPPVTIRLDPSVVEGGRRAAQTQVILDNRRGTRPQRVRLEARDPENSVRFSIAPQDLEVPAGSYATAELTMHAASPMRGETSTRTVIVSAWNGQEAIEAQGQLVQEATERTPLMRLPLIIVGSLAMIFGSMFEFLPWTTDPRRTGMQWNYDSLTRFLNMDTRSLDHSLAASGLWGPVNTLVTVGTFTIFFGLLAALGMFSKSSRLTRTAAVLGGIVLLLFAVIMVVGFAVVARQFPGLGLGYAVVLGGCVLAFVGGRISRS